MQKKLIIGLGFQARAGKDTVAEYLVCNYGFKRYAFADKLREVCSILTGENAFAPDFKDGTTPLEMSGGQLLQKVGNIMRQVHPDVWTRIVANKVNGSDYACIVIPDVRYQSDATCIREMGGILWRIYRPALAIDTHVSEQQGYSINWDKIIYNDSDLTNLHETITVLLEELGVSALDKPAASSDNPAPPQVPESAP